MAVAGNSTKQFLIGVLAHVCESWKADRDKTTAITSAERQMKRYCRSIHLYLFLRNVKSDIMQHTLVQSKSELCNKIQ